MLSLCEQVGFENSSTSPGANGEALWVTPCASCGADRGHLLGCELGTLTVAPAAPAPDLDLAEPETRRARALAVPIALAIAAVLAFTGPGSFVLRIFFGMWLHEFGHALASWCCGVFAVPLPWLTLGGESRSPVFVVLLFGVLGSLYFRFRWRVLAVPAAILLGGLLVPFRHVTTFIVFSGDGGSLVLGTVLMLGAVLLPDESPLARGALRWGYVVIGAASFMDAFITWVKAWRDVADLPFGRSEASGLSDALRLVDVSGWSETTLVRSYLGLGLLCLAVLAAAVALQLRNTGPSAS